MKLQRDESGFPCGYLYLDVSNGIGKANYSRYFFVLNHDENIFFYYLEDPKFLKPACHVGIFDLQYMSMVEDAANFKNKHPLSFVLTVSGKQYYIKAKTEDEKQAWVEELQNNARIKTKRISTTSTSSSQTCHVSYEANVAGGVVIKQPVLAESESDSDDDDSLPEKMEGWKFAAGESPIKQGYCTKQGAFMKTWKKRWFVLAESGLAYYKNFETKAPIRVVPRQEIRDVRRSMGIHLSREFLFEVVTPGRVFYIQAESVHDCEDWIESIQQLLSPRRSKSEAVIQTEHSGTLNRQTSVPGTSSSSQQTSISFPRSVGSIKFGKETPC